MNANTTNDYALRRALYKIAKVEGLDKIQAEVWVGGCIVRLGEFVKINHIQVCVSCGKPIKNWQTSMQVKEGARHLKCEAWGES